MFSLSSSSSFNRFSQQLVLLSAIVGLVSLGAYLWLPKSSPAMPFVLLLVMSVTLLMHRYLLMVTDGKPNAFINRFLMMTTLKLLGYLGVITVYALLNREDAVPFTVTFLAYYIIFSIFEVVALLRHLKHQSNTSKR